MPNPTVPDFTEHAAHKLADLLEKGFVITGYCFERQVDGTQPQRGFVDFAGFVGWWRAEMQPRKPLTDDEAAKLYETWDLELMDDEAYVVIRSVERAHGITAHGVADIKGGQHGTDT